MSGRHVFADRANKVLDAIKSSCVVISAVSIFTVVVTSGWLVFGRKVLNDTPTWVEQLALLLICYIVFVGAAAGVREDTHIGVTIFRDMLPLPIQKCIIIGIDLILAIFGLMMLASGIKLMIFGWDSLLPILDIPESFRTLAITLFGAFILITTLLRATIRIITFGEWHPGLDTADSNNIPAKEV